jgi:hypothetical protein
MENTKHHTEEVKKRVHGALHGVEAWLAPIFAKFPHIPEGGRKWLAKIAPWLALIFGILGAIALLTGGALATLGIGASVAMAAPHMLSSLVSLLFSAISIILMLMAFPGLKAMKKTGWNLIFYSQVVSIVGGVLSVVLGSGMSGLTGLVIGAIIGFWLLFEIRSLYTSVV